MAQENIEWRTEEWQEFPDAPGLYVRYGKREGSERYEAYFKSDVDQDGMIRVPSHNFDGTLKTTFRIPVDFGKDLPYGNGDEAQSIIQSYVTGAMNHSRNSFMSGPPHSPDEITPITEAEWDTYKRIARHSPWLGAYVGPREMYEPSEPTPGVNYADPEAAARMPEAQAQTWQEYQDFIAHREAAGIPEENEIAPTVDTQPFATTERGLTFAPDSHYSPDRTTKTAQQVLDSELTFEERLAVFEEAARRFPHPSAGASFADAPGDIQRSLALSIAYEMHPELQLAGVPYNHDTDSLPGAIDNGSGEFVPGAQARAEAGQDIPAFNPLQQRSTQTGEAPADASFTSLAQVRTRVADIRRQRGLAPNPDSDLEWARRIVAGDATIGDARTSLSETAEDYAMNPDSIPTVEAMNEGSFQTGEVAGDREFTDRQQIKARIAQIRENRGLDPNPEDDAVWADRVVAGRATIGDVRTLLTSASVAQLSSLRQSSTPDSAATGGQAGSVEISRGTHPGAAGARILSPSEYDPTEAGAELNKYAYWDPRIGAYVLPEPNGPSIGTLEERSDPNWQSPYADRLGVTPYGSYLDENGELRGYNASMAAEYNEARGLSNVFDPETGEALPGNVSPPQFSRHGDPTDHPYAMTSRGLTFAPDSHHSPTRRYMTVQQALDAQLTFEQRKAAFDEAARRFVGFMDMPPSSQRAQALGVARQMYPDVKVAGIPYDYEVDSRTAFVDGSENRATGYDPEAQVSFQTGAVGGDARFTSKEEIQQRVAQIRENRGLAPNSADDEQWADRILAGQASIGDARTLLTDMAAQAASPSSEADPTEENSAPSLVSEHDPNKQVSFQTGAVGGDAGYESEQDVLARVAQIRENRGLSADPGADQQWADRILAGQASIGDARTALTKEAERLAASQTISTPTTTSTYVPPASTSTTQTVTRQPAPVITEPTPSRVVSTQTGSVSGDAAFTSDAEIRARIAQIRENRGLPPDPASDRIWAERVLSGSADIGSARDAITDKARDEGAIVSSTGSHAGRTIASSQSSFGASLHQPGSDGISTIPGAMSPRPSSSTGTDIFPVA